MDRKELDEALLKHRLYVEGKPGGYCANLSYADLRGANLSDANLRGANLSGANLRGAGGIVPAAQWLSKMERDADGFIVYRAQTGRYAHPECWKFEPGAFLTEVEEAK